MAITKSKSDAEIQRSVFQELELDPNNPAISVDVRSGIVTLNGSVETYAMRRAACHGAHLVQGVLDVVDELQVKTAGDELQVKTAGAVKSDQDLALGVRQALICNVYVPDTRIESTVSNGWVTLEGNVDRMYEREDAVRVVERLQGVHGVTNKIVVEPRGVDPAKIRASIESALTRRAKREAKQIRVEVDGSTVRL